MKEYLEAVVGPLLLEPSAMEVTESRDDLGVLLSMKVALPDMGMVVGKEGATAKAIRQLLKMYGARQKARISVRFLEPNKPV